MIVLDSSALIALIAEEAGGQIVQKSLQDAVIINTINYAELLKYFKQYNYNYQGIVKLLISSGLYIHDFSKKEAELSAEILPYTKPYGLSLGDRACLATAINHNLEVLTADRTWAKINYPNLKITLIR